MDEVERREVLEKQLTMTPMTWAQMRARGVTESTLLKVDLFFYAPTEAHARALAGELRDDHGLECDVQPRDEVFSVQALAAERTYTESALVGLVRTMCSVGFKHDSEFDGWGAPIPSTPIPRKPWWKVW